MVTVKNIPTAHIINVRHTSANERDNGFIRFDIVTAIGTDTDMLTIRHPTKIPANIFWETWSKNTLKLYR